MSKFFQRFLAGIFMGFAEITPGISGATIAGLFNVYKDFVSVLTAFNPKNILDKNKKFVRNLNLPFIFPLIFGMGIAVYASSFAIDYLISEHLFIFKVFLSLIMGIAVIKNCAFDHDIRDAIKFLRGFIFGFLIALAIALTLIEMNFNNSILLIIAGFLAFSAFILPGISGSLVLLLLGSYQFVISAIKMLDVIALLPFILGMTISFLFLPAEIMKSFKANEIRTKVFFSGLILGSIPAVWLHLH